jgi:hypothetical protein
MRKQAARLRRTFAPQLKKDAVRLVTEEGKSLTEVAAHLGIARPCVALIDSATVHARNLFEFAAERKTTKFTLHALGGSAKPSKPWDQWANNLVTHMLEREHHKAPWPPGLDNSRPERLMVMAGAVLDRLEDGGKSMPGGPINRLVCGFENPLANERRSFLHRIVTIPLD